MRKFFTAIVLLAVGITASAQRWIYEPDDFRELDTCDVIKYVVNYDMEYVEDVSKHPYEYKKEPMLLQIGSKATRFYSVCKYQADSINIEEIRNKGQNHGMSCGFSRMLYKNYPSLGQYAYLDKIVQARYMYQENVVEPVWQLVPDSTATIMGHNCNMAETDFCGRKWQVWYAEDIPLSEGPWKLCGLPGLILRASDTEQQYRFEIAGIRNGRANEYILYTGKNHEKISKKSLNTMYERYHGDKLAYMRSLYPNAKITIQDKNGNSIHKTPYNPIER